MKHVLHLLNTTEYEVSADMLFARNRLDQTVVVVDGPDTLDRFITALSQLKREMENEHPRIP